MCAGRPAGSAKPASGGCRSASLHPPQRTPTNATPARRAASASYGVSPIMIGDTPYDAEAARRAGGAFVGVRCGGWSDADLQPPLAGFADPAGLPAHMDQWLKGCP